MDFNIAYESGKLALQYMYRHWIMTIIIVVLFLIVKSYINILILKSRTGLPGQMPLPLLGNMLHFFKNKGNSHINLDKWVEKNGECSVLVFMGAMTVVLADPEMLKTIFVKQFSNFHDTPGGDTFGVPEPLASALPHTKGERWRSIRNVLSPSFTARKLKGMLFIMDEASTKLVKKLEKPAQEKEPVDIRSWLQLLTMDVILSAAFGVSSDSQNNENEEVAKYGKRALMKPNAIFSILLMLPVIGKIVGKHFAISKFGFDMADLLNVTRRIVDERRKLHSVDKTAIRYDILHLLLEAQREDRQEHILTDNEVLGQSLIFLLAGQETTSSALTMIFYCLARHPEMQKRAQEELDNVVGDAENITYEHLHQLAFVEACIAETLRLFPPAVAVSREVTHDCEVGGIQFKKGWWVMIPVYYLHRHPKYWPTPDEYIPDRFMGEEKEKINPYVYTPFGQGPRNCIGLRFAMMEMKTVTAAVLKRYLIEIAPGTKFPLELRSAGILRPAEALHLIFKERASEASSEK